MGVSCFRLLVVECCWLLLVGCWSLGVVAFCVLIFGWLLLSVAIGCWPFACCWVLVGFLVATVSWVSFVVLVCYGSRLGVGCRLLSVAFFDVICDCCIWLVVVLVGCW